MKKEVYHSIYSFCKVKNAGPVFNNGRAQTPRVKWIVRLLKRLGIEYQIDKFQLKPGVWAFNVILPSTEKTHVKIITAHHDIVNPKSDNANDNSCSVINAIAAKLKSSKTMVVLTDGEEYGGIGAFRLAEQIKAGKWGQVDWILNLELTGKGGASFFMGNQMTKSKLFDRVKKLFNCPIIGVPFNDSVIFRSKGIDSVVINPLPKEELLAFNLSRLYLCHSEKDSVDKISTEDMKEFVEEVVLKIVK